MQPLCNRVTVKKVLKKQTHAGTIKILEKSSKAHVQGSICTIES